MLPAISFAFFKKLENDNSSFIYQADFNDDITEKILRLNEHNIQQSPELLKFKNKISFLMAECFQNIIHHSDKPVILNRTNNLPEMFLVRNIENTFFISSTNLVENAKVEQIKSQLNSLNKLDKNELKELYLKVLTNESYSEKGGAGLGMIEMSRKSGQKLTFEFEFINYFLSLFHLQLKLKPKTTSIEEKSVDIPISQTKELHDIMYSDNILLVFKGDFSQETILPILSMIEQNLEKSENINKKKKIYYLLVELLQNISKHGKVRNGIREGIFIIGIKGQGYFITAGNLIDNKSVEALRKKLDHINKLEESELSDLYKKNLLEEKSGFKGGAGLGLIDIARNSNEKILYDVISMDDNSSFFSLNITI